jgi:hypothetical protein
VAGPILIHVGYHKTGSGWLRRYFFGHPQTSFAWLGKGPERQRVRRLVTARPFEFDAGAFRSGFEALVRPVEARGLSPVLSLERLSGHPFSGGYDAKEIADRLAAVFPEGRVLAVLREQRSMVLSTYKHYVRSGGASSLGDFLAQPQTPSMRVPLFDLRHFEYHHLLRYYRGLFGPDRVLVLTYEQFVRDPATFLGAISAFAGRPLAPEVLATVPVETRSNPSPSATAIGLSRRINSLGGRRTEVDPAPLFRSRLLAKAARRAERARFVPRRLDARNEARLRQVVAEAIGDRFVQSNRATAELTGIDLAAYGWMV